MAIDTKPIKTLIGILFGIANRVHIKHLYYCQSYAEHTLLEKLYKTIRDGADKVAENCIARNHTKTLLESYKGIDGYPMESNKDTFIYLDTAKDIFNSIRQDNLSAPSTKSLIENILEELDTLKYLFKVEYKMLPLQVKSAVEQPVEVTDIPSFTREQFEQAIQYKYFGKRVEIIRLTLLENNKCEYEIAVDSMLINDKMDAEKFIKNILKTRKQYNNLAREAVNTYNKEIALQSIGFNSIYNAILFKDAAVKKKVTDTDGLYDKIVSFFMKCLVSNDMFMSAQWVSPTDDKERNTLLTTNLDKITQLKHIEIYENDEVPYVNIFGISVPEPIFELQQIRQFICRPIVLNVRNIKQPFSSKTSTEIELALVASFAINKRYVFRINAVPLDVFVNERKASVIEESTKESYLDIDNQEPLSNKYGIIIIPDTRTKIRL